MKKLAFLAMVLAMSTVALGVPKVDVKATPSCPDTCDDVKLAICGCAPGNYQICDVRLSRCVGGQFLILDVYMEKGCGPCIDKPFETCYTLGTMCPGTYMVAVKLHLKGYTCSCTSDVVALASTSFTVAKKGCWPWYGYGCDAMWPFWSN
jgi:hypothetical protein